MPGHTPLVGWLKGYMIPEMLGISISSKLESQKPANYANMQGHISDFEAKYFKEKDKRKIDRKERDENDSDRHSCDNSRDNMDVK